MLGKVAVLALPELEFDFVASLASEYRFECHANHNSLERYFADTVPRIDCCYARCQEIFATIRRTLLAQRSPPKNESESRIMLENDENSRFVTRMIRRTT